MCVCGGRRNEEELIRQLSARILFRCAKRKQESLNSRSEHVVTTISLLIGFRLLALSKHWGQGCKLRHKKRKASGLSTNGNDRNPVLTYEGINVTLELDVYELIVAQNEIQTYYRRK